MRVFGRTDPFQQGHGIRCQYIEEPRLIGRVLVAAELFAQVGVLEAYTHMVKERRFQSTHRYIIIGNLSFLQLQKPGENVLYRTLDGAGGCEESEDLPFRHIKISAFFRSNSCSRYPAPGSRTPMKNR